jgi:hypothetical protein
LTRIAELGLVLAKSSTVNGQITRVKGIAPLAMGLDGDISQSFQELK